MKRHVLTLFLLPALAFAATAQEKVVRDEWVEYFHFGQKVSWQHEVLKETPGVGFKVEVTAFYATGDGKLATRIQRTETDANGVIRRHSLKRETPWGNHELTVRVAGGVMTWRQRVRAQAVQTSKSQGAPLERTVVYRRLLRGELKPGKHAIKVLDVRKKGTKDDTVAFRVDGTGSKKTVVIEVEEGVGTYDAGGKFRHMASKQVLDLRGYACTAEQARDMQRVRKPSRLPGVRGQALTWQGIRIKRPGPGWVVLFEKSEKGAPTLGLMHVSEVAVALQPLPIAPPASEKKRLELGKDLMRYMAKDGGGMRLSDPQPVTFNKNPSVRFTVGGSEGGQKLKGIAYLTHGGPSGVLMLAAAPADLHERLQGLLKIGQAAITLGKAPLQALETRKVVLKKLGLELQVPRSWKEPKAGSFQHPERYASFTAQRSTLPAGVSADQALSAWSKRFGQRLRGAKITRRGAGTFGGRACRTIRVEGLLPAQEMEFAGMAAAFLVPQADGSYIDVIVVGFAIGELKLAHLDAIVKSAKFSKKTR